MACLFTVITVCFNAERYIEATINSVLSQTNRSFEYIIKDGISKDGTLAIIERLTGLAGTAGLQEQNGTEQSGKWVPQIRLLTGNDKGIYDAMNLAVGEALGEYIVFMNAGDVFTDEAVLQRVADRIEADKKADIYYGDIYEIGPVADKSGKVEKPQKSLRTYTKKNAKLWYYALGACLNHQAMFCRTELFETRQFDLSYKICADREWQLYHIRHGAKASPLGFPTADILTEGASSENLPLLEAEIDRCVKTYCGRWYGMYRLIALLKRNRFLHKIIHGSEQRLSTRKQDDE